MIYMFGVMLITLKVRNIKLGVYITISLVLVNKGFTAQIIKGVT